jgi:hypothetical protein
MQGEVCGWLSIEMGNLKQKIFLIAQPRPFGGRQWYFICPYMNRRALVLWVPPGGTKLCLSAGMGTAGRLCIAIRVP